MRLHALILGGLALGAGQLPAQEIGPAGTASAGLQWSVTKCCRFAIS
jgi:hypothetical protein